MSITLHHGDIPADLDFGASVAVDTETMGLSLVRDRLCVVQLSAGDGTAHLVKLTRDYDCPNLKRLLANPDVLKIFHFARFDVAMIKRSLGVDCAPLYCTKIASKLCRTNTDRHGLKDLCLNLLGVEISKEQQTSDWGAEVLTEQQQAYAAQDVLYLHRLKEVLDALLTREGRVDLAAECFLFLPTRGALDLAGWDEVDIFAH
ncbi:Ribonuclease D related protein [Caenispirillum salinarum AK4]|uniref:Ribonuclease D related protein n=1 Tax=Caenispirillum salinarum AK4 TaxID=1238182 RepID=K9HNT1_9PROT|nr:ribonuclease D [Caenispirillum salinarum]EKV31988.1 Ribonuclease D related protein [Caenispirillum salinarum AK4]